MIRREELALPLRMGPRWAGLIGLVLLTPLELAANAAWGFCAALRQGLENVNEAYRAIMEER